MPLSVSSAPAMEPVTQAEVKLHSRIDTSADDDKIDAFITAARIFLESVTGRAFVQRTYTLTIDHFPLSDYIELPKPPLSSVTSVQYVDNAGTTQTFSSGSYTVDTACEPGRIYVDRDTGWPSDVKSQRNAVTVTYVAGYADADAVPEEINQCLLTLIGNWYENRESTLPGTIITDVPHSTQWLIDNLKVRGGLQIYSEALTAP